MNALQLFRSGLDTIEIAACLGITEAEAYSRVNDELTAEYSEKIEWRDDNARPLSIALGPM